VAAEEASVFFSNVMSTPVGMVEVGAEGGTTTHKLVLEMQPSDGTTSASDGISALPFPRVLRALD
jgi:hypothetical protein